MAINFSSNNLSSNNNNTFTLEKFNGVDYTTTPTNVDDTRAIEISNYLNSGNSLVKRYGYSHLIKLEEKISNLFNEANAYKIVEIWQFNGKYICYIMPNNNNNSLRSYLISLDNFTSASSSSYSILRELISSDDKYAYGVEFENHLFIFCANNYFVIDRYFECVPVGTIAYVPTILTGLGAKNSTVKAKIIEDFNMMSMRYKIEIYVDSLNSKFDFSLYSRSDYIVKSINGFNYSQTQFDYTYVDENGVETNYEFSQGALIEYVDGTNKRLAVVQVRNYSGSQYISKSDTEVIVDISLIGGSLSSMPRNFTIEFQDRLDTTSYTITNMRFGIPFGTYGSKDRLFVAGHPSYKHIDFHTGEATYAEEEWYDYTYFPDTSYHALGTSDTAIIGYGILSNGTMAIFKESKEGQPNLFFRNADIQNIEDEYSVYNQLTNQTISYPYIISKEIYPVTNSGLSLDITKETKIALYDNKLIFNTPKGIHYISIDSSTSSQTYSAYELSYFIRDNLSNDISDSNIIVYKNSLYVLRRSKDGKKRIYVADSDRYSFVDSKMQYEWWVLDGIDADKIYVFNDELYFTNSTGIFKFIDNQFYDYDVTYVNDITINGTTISSEVFIDTSRDRLIVNSSSDVFKKIRDHKNLYNGYLDFIDNTKINIAGYLVVELPFEYEIVDGKIKIFVGDTTDIFYLIKDYGLTMHVNGTMYKYIQFEYVYDDRNYVLITATNAGTSDIESNYIALSGLSSVNFTIHSLYTLVHGTYYDIKECSLENNEWYYRGANNEYFDLLGNSNETNFNILELELAKTPVKIEDGVSIISKIKFMTYTPIYSYWYSKYNYLGRLDYLKSVNYLYFVPMTRRGGLTHIGYKTSKQDVSYISNQHTDVDFNEIIFDDFSFDQIEFGRTYSAKKKIKNFSFIQLFIYSEEIRDSSISTLVFRYKYTKNNKGVK